jgi:hypothetical protein
MTKIDKYDNLSNFNKSSIAWFAIYIGIALAVLFTIPFPLSLLFYLGIYLFLQSYRMESIQKRLFSHTDLNKEDNNKTKKKGPNKFFNSISNILFNDNLYSQFGPQPLKFICMNCGKEHNERACPVCGSTAVRLG